MVIEKPAAYVGTDINISVHRVTRTDTATIKIPQASKHRSMQNHSQTYSVGCYSVV